jgi:uncharacterized coiled-coil protein SlyX
MKNAVSSYFSKILNLDDLVKSNNTLSTRVDELEKQVCDLERTNEELSKSVAAVAIIQANLLRELQTLFNNHKKAALPVFVQRKTDDYTN